MGFLGRGVLVIWNDIDEAFEAEFLRWHVLEHIPERVGLPGFLRGQRYVGLDGTPKYFNFYETEDVDALSSDAYRARLNDPTEWTRRVVAHFRNTTRTICTLVASYGRGDGAFIETLRLTTSRDPAQFRQAVSKDLLPKLADHEGISGAYLLEGAGAASRGDSAEKHLRGAPDQVADWVILIEAVEAAFLENLRRTAGAASILESLGVASCERGIDRLQFGLTKQELSVRPEVETRTWQAGDR